MSLFEAIKPHRDYYLNYFKSGIKEIRQKEQGATEILLKRQSNSQENVYDYFRPDFLNSDNGIVEINTDGFLNHDPIELNAGNISIVLHPIIWNGCEIFIDSEPVDYSFLTQWIEKWMLFDESKIQHEDIMICAVHSVEKPYRDGNWTVIPIDLGTSPVDSLIDLIELLVNFGGAKKIEIGSPTMINNNNAQLAI